MGRIIKNLVLFLNFSLLKNLAVTKKISKKGIYMLFQISCFDYIQKNVIMYFNKMYFSLKQIVHLLL
jgi:hypothetical protein